MLASLKIRRTLVLIFSIALLCLAQGPLPSPYTGAGGGGSGTVTSIATTSPITGGTITTTGTIACASCVTSSSPGLGIGHFAGSTQALTSSLIVAADITAATITGTQIASSVALAGSPTTTTQAASDNSTKIATTAYVDRVAVNPFPKSSFQASGITAIAVQPNDNTVDTLATLTIGANTLTVGSVFELYYDSTQGQNSQLYTYAVVVGGTTVSTHLRGTGAREIVQTTCTVTATTTLTCGAVLFDGANSATIPEAIQTITISLSSSISLTATGQNAVAAANNATLYQFFVTPRV